MCRAAAAQSQLLAFDDATPVLDWVITSRGARARSLSFVLAGSLVLATLAIAAALHRNGLGEHGSTPIAIAVVVFVALRSFMRQEHCLCERIVIKGGAMRIAHYQSGELVEQRRLKLAGLAIEYRADGNSACSFLALRTDERAHRPRRRIVIARHLTPIERAEFLRDFLLALCSTGVNPAIFDHDGCPRALNDWPFSHCADSPCRPSPWRHVCVSTATCGAAR